MMDQFVSDLTTEWTALGLPLSPAAGPAACSFCRKPVGFAREVPACRQAGCPLDRLAAAA
jgi:hypothetical protein